MLVKILLILVIAAVSILIFSYFVPLSHRSRTAVNIVIIALAIVLCVVVAMHPSFVRY